MSPLPAAQGAAVTWMCRPVFPMTAASSTSQSTSWGTKRGSGGLHPPQLGWGRGGTRGGGRGALTLLSAGCTMSSKGPAMALGNLLKMRGSLGTLTSCSRQWSR